MKIVQISNEDILKGFTEKNTIYVRSEDEELHERLLSGRLSVDPEGDIEAWTNGEHYWITTEPEITRFNKACDYAVSFKYKVHKDSKYCLSIFELYR